MAHVYERQRGAFRDLGFTASDGFLQEAANDPRISGDGRTRKSRMGIHFPNEQSLEFAKSVAHDVFEKIMCKKTLACEATEASKKRM